MSSALETHIEAQRQHRCVHCGAAVRDLVKDFGRGAFRLTDCAYCKKVADPYIEVDLTFKFIDVLLQKESVYRHILFNSKSAILSSSPGHILRLLLGLTLFDSYTNWALLESGSRLVDQQLLHVFLASLLSSAVSVTVYLGLLTTISAKVYNQNSRIVFRGLLISMFGAFFNLLLLAWEADLRLRYGIQALIYTSNIVALKVISGCNNYYKPFLTICFCALVREICVAITCALTSLF